MALLHRLGSRVFDVSSSIGYRRFASTIAAASAGKQNKMTEILPTVIKSPLDKREYRAMVLSNKMKVICCSDSTTDKAAASLSVGAGSMNEPENIPGLAHFCEHMLFLGTEKYPQENDYSKFLADNGGGSNAYTAKDHTNYFFNVAPDALPSALDRFSQFFLTPLFTESATEREINAVNSEHEKNISVDAWRAYQLELTTGDPRHPYSRFATGNRKTLWDVPRENNIDICTALREFYMKHYSANIMCLSVIGKETLDELQSMVEEMFATVKNADAELAKWVDSPFPADRLKKEIRLVPVKDIRHLSVTFPLPDMSEFYKSSAEGYLSHLLGHEGEGSLLSLLKRRQWANSLEAGASVPARGIGAFRVAVDLTPDGFKHTNDIVEHIFQYLRMLREIGPQRWVWDEMRDIHAMTFRFKDKEHPQTLVSNLASVMHSYPLEDALSAGHILTDYNENLILDVLEQLNPDNCRVMINALENEPSCTETEQWYGVKHKVQEIDDTLLEKWKSCSLHPDMKLPSKNEFIPTNFDLKPRDSHTGVVPRIIHNSPFSRVWYLQDNEFLLPKALIRVEAHSPLPLLDPVNANLNHMMVAVAKDALTEFSYAASVAGLEYGISESIYGHEVMISGYDEKSSVLVQEILKKMTKFECPTDRFEVLKELYARSLKNWKDEQPYHHASYYVTTLLREKRWTNQELLDALEGVTLENLNVFVKNFTSKLKLEWLLYGNLTAAEATDLTTKCHGLYQEIGSQPLLPSQTVRMREVELKEGSNFLFKTEHQSHLSSCAAVLFQAGEQSTKANVLLELMQHIAHEPCFNQLRTQEQLGYIVFASLRRANGTHGLQIMVQSDRHPSYVERRISNFMENLNEMLHKMTDEEFLLHRSALRTRKAEKPKKLNGRGSLLWAEIAGQYYNFERQKVELAALDELSREELLKYFDELFSPESTKRHKLSVHIISKTGAASVQSNEVDGSPADSEYPGDQEVIEDPTEWKIHQHLFPTTKPSAPLSSFIGTPVSKL